jgi:hypothetical protein
MYSNIGNFTLHLLNNGDYEISWKRGNVTYRVLSHNLIDAVEQHAAHHFLLCAQWIKDMENLSPTDFIEKSGAIELISHLDDRPPSINQSQQIKWDRYLLVKAYNRWQITNLTLPQVEAYL